MITRIDVSLIIDHDDDLTDQSLRLGVAKLCGETIAEQMVSGVISTAVIDDIEIHDLMRLDREWNPH
jgi:hypothetical protein